MSPNGNRTLPYKDLQKENRVLFPDILQTFISSSISRLKGFSFFHSSSHGKYTVPVTIFLLFSEVWCCSYILLKMGEPAAMTKWKPLSCHSHPMHPISWIHSMALKKAWTGLPPLQPLLQCCPAFVSSHHEQSQEYILFILLKVASMWFVMIRSSSGQKGLTNGTWRNEFL